MSFFKTKNGNSIFHKGPALQAAGLAVLLFFLSGCEKELETAQIALGGKSFTVEIARTPAERQKGLMDRKELADDRGMLFIFEYDQRLSFWMKNTYIPLDIAYISKDGRIREIHRMKPLSEKPVVSGYSVRYALEVNAGTFEALGVQAGDRLTLPVQ